MLYLYETDSCIAMYEYEFFLQITTSNLGFANNN